MGIYLSTLKKNVIANYAGKAWAAIINIAFVPLYIKYMGIEAYGLVGIFATIQPLMTILDLGLSPSINRELARYSATSGQEQVMRNLVRTLEVVYWGLAALLCMVVFLFSPVVASSWVKAQALPLDVVSQSVALMGLSIVLQWPVGFYTGGLMGLQRQVLFNMINTVIWTLRGVGALLVVMVSHSPVLAFFWWQLIMSIVNVTIVAVTLWRSLPASQGRSRFQFGLVRSIWRLAIGMSAVSVVILIFNQMDKIILSKQIPLREFGYYSLAWQVVGSLFMLYYPIYAAFFPVLTQLRAQEDFEALKLAYHKGCQFMAVAVFPIAVVLCVYSREILTLWVADPVTVQYSYLVMSVLLVGATLNGLLYMPYSLQQAFGETKYILYVFIPFLLVYAPLLVISVKLWGVIGAAVAFSAISLVQNALAIFITHKRFIPGEQAKWFYEDLCRPLAASLVVVVGLRFTIFWDMSGLPGLATIVFCYLLSLVVTVLATPATSNILRRYLLPVSSTR